MARHGVHLALERQDDYSQMVAEQALFAQEVANGVARPAKGAAFVVIMGDALPGYAASAKAALDKLGQQIEVVGALGYSRGEDKCMLPAEVVADPQKARGSLIGAVLRDGDWNICIKYAADNKIPVNADPKTYDPDAMNFVSVGAFTEADEKLIAASKGACETRPVVSAGKLTGESAPRVPERHRHVDAGRREGRARSGRPRGRRVDAASTCGRCPPPSSATSSGWRRTRRS